MRFVFINGYSERFTLHELLSVFRHPASITTMTVAGALIIWLNPDSGVIEPASAQAVIYWGLLLPGCFLSYLVTLVALARWRATAYSIIAHLVCASFSALITPVLQYMLGIRPAEPAEMLVEFGFTLVTSCAIELFMVTYLARHLRPRSATLRAFADHTDTKPEDLTVLPAPQHEPEPATEPSPEPGEAATVQIVMLLGRAFVLADLRLISAEEHYVRIHTPTTQTLLRGRISDIEAQLPETHGLRVHRSHWVARGAVRQLNRHRDGWTLDLCLGIEVPVARARREAVRDWLDHNETRDEQPRA